MSASSGPEHDVWRRKWKERKGLGKSGLSIVTAMRSGGRWTVKELSTATGKCDRTVRRNLARLCAVGLTTPEGDGIYTATADPPDLDELAVALGCAGMGDRQRANHREQRKDWAGRLKRARRVGG